jgi:AAA+ superfamily predicted ATPase
MKMEVNFADEMITQFVIESLKRDYEIADEDELKNAISVVLEYYMDPQQWADWNKEKVF